MLLNNLMEDKQLNFDQPLLSVRRLAAAVASERYSRRQRPNKSLPNVPRPPPYRSELKSGPVTNPGVVPFVWEQSPGKPKDENKPEDHSTKRPPSAPKLPPGRIPKANQQDPDKDTAISSKKQVENVNYALQTVSYVDEDAKKVAHAENSKDAKEENKMSDSDEGDEVYQDALDTLSRTESFFLNCSLSGLSGLDEVGKSLGTFTADPQTRDFMMGRFLPAAKAMASETPQHASRKQPVAQEQPRLPKKVTNGNKRPSLRYGPSFALRYSHSDDYEEESSDDYDDDAHYPVKACGLLPRLCLKGSICLLNPVPAMSVRTRRTVSHTNRKHAMSSSTGSCSSSSTENERSTSDISERKSVGGSCKTELHKDRNGAKNELSKVIYESNRSERKRTGYNHEQLQARKDEVTYDIPEDANDVGLDNPGSHEKSCKSFQELLEDRSSHWEHSGDQMVEKTLYIDSIHKVEPPNVKSSALELSDLEAKQSENLPKKIEENPSKVSYLEDTDRNIMEEVAKLQPINNKPAHYNIRSAEKLNHGMPRKTIKASRVLVTQKEGYEHSKKQFSNRGNIENPSEISKLLVPPPLPKSPSDSWLCRTLPSVSKKNSSLRPYAGTEKNSGYEAVKTQATDPKWETMVKSTKGQHLHLRFSEEQVTLTPIPEN